MNERSLKLADHKTEVVLLTGRRRVGDVLFKRGESVVKPKQAAKYFGVWIDRSLSFDEHII